MAHFFKPPDGERVSKQTVQVPLGSVVPLGLWGCCESPGVYIEIKIGDPSVARFEDILGSHRDPVSQEFKLYGQATGKTRVNAVTTSGAIWDWFDVMVNVAPPAPPTPAEQLFNHYKA